MTFLTSLFVSKPCLVDPSHPPYPDSFNRSLPHILYPLWSHISVLLPKKHSLDPLALFVRWMKRPSHSYRITGYNDTSACIQHENYQSTFWNRYDIVQKNVHRRKSFACVASDLGRLVRRFLARFILARKG